jgi:hypothetical protein
MRAGPRRTPPRPVSLFRPTLRTRQGNKMSSCASTPGISTWGCLVADILRHPAKAKTPPSRTRSHGPRPPPRTRCPGPATMHAGREHECGEAAAGHVTGTASWWVWVWVVLRAMSTSVGRRPRAMPLAPPHGGYGYGRGLCCTTGHERKCGEAAAGHVTGIPSWWVWVWVWFMLHCGP